MLSKLNERGDKKKILIVEIDEHQSRENSKSKVKKEYTESFEYGTDNKKSLNQSNKELD